MLLHQALADHPKPRLEAFELRDGNLPPRAVGPGGEVLRSFTALRVSGAGLHDWWCIDVWKIGDVIVRE
jgi:hypothetical protein